MSYCRFGWDGSSVYIYEHYAGNLECCGCSLERDHWNYKDVAEFLAHLDAHTAAGDTVPDDVRPMIVKDWVAGEFSKWDETDPAAMEPYLHYGDMAITEEPYTEFLARNKHMLGEHADELIEAIRKRET